MTMYIFKYTKKRRRQQKKDRQQLNFLLVSLFVFVSLFCSSFNYLSWVQRKFATERKEAKGKF